MFHVLMFTLAAAGMGGCFQALFTAQRYITEGTYDPRYKSSDWTHITLGLPAGIMLANLIPISADDEPLTMPLLALVGGSSATLVHRVLTKLVSMAGRQPIFYRESQ